MEVRLSEIISALSYALDVTEGQPAGHAARTCAIGMRIADIAGVPHDELSSLYYALLLKDAGCSANAAAVCTLFGSDDRTYKELRKRIDYRSKRANAVSAFRSTLPGAPIFTRVKRLAEIARQEDGKTDELYGVRCERGAEIARMIELPESTAEAIRALDEHWDGGGVPYGLRGTEIPLAGRILALAQIAEVYFTGGGVDAALAVAAERSGRWFDPDLVAALLTTRDDRAFWASLHGDAVELVKAFEPTDHLLMADEEGLDRVAEAFAMVVDAKSPFTGRHSAGVAHIALGVAETMDLEADCLRDLRRAALLHDLGKLGVSNLVLDKPGKLDADEWAEMRRHAELTVRILERVPPFRHLARDAGAHHERLDGRGYHLGLTAGELGWMPRTLAVADVFEALTADRPYRDALDRDEALAIMRRDVGAAFSPEHFEALEAWANRSSLVPAAP
ncbi:HD domain-containing protein [Solirubrobacter sp. CPCC 204708]|uniref:HD domain-containing protein n=1 Tax=Solirubrobacter deserti TaxID=2282478 RepID=A0ABT4RLI8_9ACTN|nr:HD domain-containing phosphohydrolase [Solirubrobacter deserti]MBE2320435.1 HD domain-containing protein [Solirubrobacter deserti]MDA0139374.1 HD domain-containing protein [Solirubrobacter deserti]